MNDQRFLKSPVSPDGENFRLGKILITTAARDAVAGDNDDIDCYWASHMLGDWGEVDDEEWMANNAAVVAGHGEVRSISPTPNGEWIEIVTNADWTQTIVRLR